MLVITAALSAIRPSFPVWTTLILAEIPLRPASGFIRSLSKASSMRMSMIAMATSIAYKTKCSGCGYFLRKKDFPMAFLPSVVRWDHNSPHFMTSQDCASQQELEISVKPFPSNSGDDHFTAMKARIEVLCKLGNVSDAISLLRNMLDRQIRVDLNTYNSLLAAACEQNCFDIFSEVFKHLLFSDVPPDLISYVNIAKAFEKVTNLDFLEFINEVSEITKEKGPTVVNRIIFITAKSGQIEKSIKIFEKLENMEFKMNIVTYNTILAILGRAGQADRMISCFKSMKNLGYIPDLVTYNTLINCLRWLGRLDLYKVFVQEMLDRGIEMDLRTYTAIIDGLGRAGHVGHALEMFHEMKKVQQPSIYVYRSLIGSMKKSGNLQMALELLDEMNSRASKLVGPEDFKRKRTWKAFSNLR